MSGDRDATSNRRLIALVSAALAALAALALADRGPDVDLRRFLPVDAPLLLAATACLLGLFALQWLERSFGRPTVERPIRLRPMAMAVAAAIPFMVLVTLLDLALPFPADLNVPLPTAWWFYPAIGLVAQFALHLVPFALALALLGATSRSHPSSVQVAAAVVLSALPEALLQAAAGPGSSAGPDAQAILVATHLLIFGIVELSLYLRFGFAAMVVFRWSYNAYWHIAWGTLRLRWTTPLDLGG